MKKFSALLAALVLAFSALMLVACGPGPDDTDGPGTDTDGPGVVDPGDPDDPGSDTDDPEPAATPGLVFELLSEQELAYHNLDYGHTYTAAYAVTNYDVEETEDVTDLVIPSTMKGSPSSRSASRRSPALRRSRASICRGRSRPSTTAPLPPARR